MIDFVNELVRLLSLPLRGHILIGLGITLLILSPYWWWRRKRADATAPIVVEMEIDVHSTNADDADMIALDLPDAYGTPVVCGCLVQELVPRNAAPGQALYAFRLLATGEVWAVLPTIAVNSSGNMIYEILRDKSTNFVRVEQE